MSEKNEVRMDLEHHTIIRKFGLAVEAVMRDNWLDFINPEELSPMIHDKDVWERNFKKMLYPAVMLNTIFNTPCGGDIRMSFLECQFARECFDKMFAEFKAGVIWSSANIAEGGEDPLKDRLKLYGDLVELGNMASKIFDKYSEEK